MILPPQNPIAAVTHPDPYPYYTDLLANRPIYRDETTGFWIASSAATVTAILTNDLCRVRPPTEQVPTALLGSLTANIFGHLVRMNDGQKHGPMKMAVSKALQAIGTDQVAEQSNIWASLLADELEPKNHSGRLTDFAFQLPAYVVANLFGVPQENLQQTALWVSDFVRCLAPDSSPDQLAQGQVAANHLLDLLLSLLDAQETAHSESLLCLLLREARLVGCTDRDVVVANSIGLLLQTYEATAGLIGNTLLALARYQDVHAQILTDPARLDLVIQEVLRYDPPVQNTRRYLSAGGVVAGEEMKAGDGVLVVLAAANRDPKANSNPERFDIFRKTRRLFTFGTGLHECPGKSIATIIARIGVEQLILSGVHLPSLTTAVSYRPSGNARLPLFEGGTL